MSSDRPTDRSHQYEALSNNLQTAIGHLTAARETHEAQAADLGAATDALKRATAALDALRVSENGGVR